MGDNDSKELIEMLPPLKNYENQKISRKDHQKPNRLPRNVLGSSVSLCRCRPFTNDQDRCFNNVRCPLMIKIEPFSPGKILTMPPNKRETHLSGEFLDFETGFLNDRGAFASGHIQQINGLRH